MIQHWSEMTLQFLVTCTLITLIWLGIPIKIRIIVWLQNSLWMIKKRERVPFFLFPASIWHKEALAKKTAHYLKQTVTQSCLVWKTSDKIVVVKLKTMNTRNISRMLFLLHLKSQSHVRKLKCQQKKKIILWSSGLLTCHNQ